MVFAWLYFSRRIFDGPKDPPAYFEKYVWPSYVQLLDTLTGNNTPGHIHTSNI